MKAAWRRIGVWAYWASWLGLVVYLRGRPRTRAIIRCGQQIVVVKGWLGDGKWVLPGGGLHANETPLAGLLREVAEETGLRLERAWVRPFFTAEYRHYGIHFPCHYFLVTLDERLPLRAQPLEISDVAWVEAATLTARNANLDVLTALQHMKAAAAPDNLLQ